jgi:hypothetical protein
MLIAGNKTLITHEGQIQTYFTCHEVGHFTQSCPHRRTSFPKPKEGPINGSENSWAQTVQEGKAPTHCDDDNRYGQGIPIHKKQTSANCKTTLITERIDFRRTI